MLRETELDQRFLSQRPCRVLALNLLALVVEVVDSVMHSRFAGFNVPQLMEEIEDDRSSASTVLQGKVDDPPALQPDGHRDGRVVATRQVEMFRIQSISDRFQYGNVLRQLWD